MPENHLGPPAGRHAEKNPAEGTHATGTRTALAEQAALVEQVQAWIADEVDPQMALQLQELLDAQAWGELTERFSGPLTFGTAGLRGAVRAGPNGMNRAVVRRAAAGISTWLPAGSHVVIGYDARHGSYDFAHDSAGILTAAGHRAQVLPVPLPTPVLAYAVRHLGADLAIMVTASHNPPQDNGYKVYLGDGAQIVPPADAQIEAAIRAVGPVCALPLDTSYTVLGDELQADYIEAISNLIDPSGPRGVRIVHTAMHGVGSQTMTAVLGRAGFSDVLVVAEQAEPDAAFPTVAFPNPEEPGAIDLALALALRSNADLVLASDPDADRCGVAVPEPGGWRMLRGDEVGVLLADALIRKGIRGTYATTIVSSSMLAAMTQRNNLGFAETLTGFKWISRAADDLVYGYEEALGYAVAPGLVRDKDGISAGLLLAELAAQLLTQGSSLSHRLDELAEEYGLFDTDQLSVRVGNLSEITTMMRNLRKNPPAMLLGVPVTVHDLLPRTDGVRLRFDGGRVVVRPSGTEPKLKAYLEVVQPDADRTVANLRMSQLRSEIAQVLGLRP